MKKIIDGYKYDTETSKSIISYQLNSKDKAELYRNGKFKFFCVHYIVNAKSGEIETELYPITKNTAMKILTDENAVDQFENLFGKLPEAEGEDYMLMKDAMEVDMDEEYNVTETGDMVIYIQKEQIINAAVLSKEPEEINQVAEVTEVEPPEEVIEKIEVKTKKAKPSRAVQKKLTEACKENNLLLAKSSLTCGAVIKKKHLHQALLTRNADLIKLIIDSSETEPRTTDIDTAILTNNDEIVLYILAHFPTLRVRAVKTAVKYNPKMLESINDLPIDQKGGSP